MKKVLVLGSNKDLEESGGVQHNSNDFFGEVKKVYVDLFGADITHNLNSFPYPFKDNEFDGVFASHVIEHLRKDKLISLFNELHRICKNDSMIYIFVPHFSNVSSFTHMTHYSFFGMGTMDYICDNCDGWEKYIRGKFNLINKKLTIPRRFFFVKIFRESVWEDYLSRIFPAHEIKFVLEVRKNEK